MSYLIMQACVVNEGGLSVAVILQALRQEKNCQDPQLHNHPHHYQQHGKMKLTHRKHLKCSVSNCSPKMHTVHLSLFFSQFDTVDEQDSTLVSFYKMNSANWSAPLKCRLTGDSAVGKGVNRHVLSMMMQKLKTGFALNLGTWTC